MKANGQSSSEPASKPATTPDSSQASRPAPPITRPAAANCAMPRRMLDELAIQHKPVGRRAESVRVCESAAHCGCIAVVKGDVLRHAYAVTSNLHELAAVLGA